ncbi:hypothetical protein PHYPSEUDO_009299 [Phytophthora pseudosyringae]|uniref:Expansin-like EG45 domain-containing protein n=1 Tax=Phytophthora pseudosyringae TaxID=221518 RepID=A0A8T1VC94_9STRA|nr:hypothetical protein PHYPSEUDO_009299 [Phytophthora pseudosyringae]
MFRQVSLLAAALPAVALAGMDSYYMGEGIPYTHERFSAGNCNFMYDPGVGNYYAALSSDQWNSTLNCGRCAELSSDGASSSVTVFIVDECSECADEDLGLSPLVFKQLTRSDPSQSSSIRWRFVDCPVSGNVEYCANSRSKSSWLALQPANAVTGVASVKIANQDATVADSGYYFVLTGRPNVNMSAVTIELTSVSGETITETLSLTAGNCTAGTSNFGGASAGKQQQNEVNEYFDSLKSGTGSTHGDGGYKAGKVAAPDDTELTTTRSEATSSGSSLLFVVPVLLVVVGGIIVAAVAYAAKRKKALVHREKAPFGTLRSPALVKETIAKI